MIIDLFSHKIHSSGDAWQDKLVDIATIFAEFDGLPYDRDKIEDRFKQISPRASVIARDPSKYRDEISAYPSYLGLYYLKLENGVWVLRLSETAKQFLIVEEPNVQSFMMLQQLMFQYPNGMGARYYSSNGSATIQANARNKTLEYISNGIHVSPFRLICKALLADSKINGISSLHPSVRVEEIYILANDTRTNQTTSPDLNSVSMVLAQARSGLLKAPIDYQSRFHILNHTDFLEVSGGWIRLRETVDPDEREEFVKKLNIINLIDFQYNGFDKATTGSDLSSVILSSEWGQYFDAVVQLSAEMVKDLTNENFAPVSSIATTPIIDQESDDLIPDNKAIQFTYELRERDGSLKLQSSLSKKAAQLADPEVTRIKRQRSNLEHRVLISKMDELLRKKGAVPQENEHIDLFSHIPGDGKFLFEMKSVSSENLLSQTRKGLSQLYEYRYRYKSKVGYDVNLCLVYNKEPNEIDWLENYLCDDRDIAVCWFEGETLKYPTSCANKFQNLL